MNRHNCTDTISGAALSSAVPLSWHGWLEDGKALMMAELKRTWATIKVWHQRSVQRSHLEQLDAHMLDDIGLTREEANRIARKPFWKE